MPRRYGTHTSSKTLNFLKNLKNLHCEFVHGTGLLLSGTIELHPCFYARRKIAKLCHLYKLVYDCQNAPVVQRPPNYSRRRNPIQLQQVSTHSSQFHFSFYPHTISLWNNLSISNDSLISTCSFKRSIS